MSPHRAVSRRHGSIVDVEDDDASSPSVVVRHTTTTDEEWLHRYLSLDASGRRALRSRFPGGVDVIRRLGRERLHAWLKYFLSDEKDGGIGLDHAGLRRMVLSRPILLTYGLSNVMSTTAYFRTELGLSQDEYSSMLLSYPSVLMHGVNTRLRPTVEFLQNECGGGKDNWSSWRRVICSYPSVFSYSTERVLLPKLKFLMSSRNEDDDDDDDDDKSDGRSYLCLSRSEVSQVVSKFPPTLWLSEGNLRSKLDYLVTSLGLVGPDLRNIIVTYPQILGLSLEGNLVPKVDFFIDDAGLCRDQLREFVLYQPALLAYSLEGRLRPRIARMRERNISL